MRSAGMFPRTLLSSAARCNPNVGSSRTAGSSDINNNTALDASRLRAAVIPRGRQVLTPRDCALYALSVGLGADPMDERQIDYVDENRGPRIVPSMALVIAHPGFWLGNPETGVDPTTVLHAEQRFEMLAPLRCGEAIVSETRITGLFDKGPGKAALLFTETELCSESGVPLARLARITYLRGGGGFGGVAPERPMAPQPPSLRPDQVIDLPTRPEQALLYRLNGDLNPLHVEPRTAERAGFARPILHGLCTMGIVCHALLRGLASYDNRRLRSMSLRFCNPVIPGATLRVELWKDGSFRAYAASGNVLVVDQGVAVIDPPSGSVN